MDLLKWNALSGYIRRSQTGMPCRQLLQRPLQGPWIERTPDPEQETRIGSLTVGAQLMEEPESRLISVSRRKGNEADEPES